MATQLRAFNNDPSLKARLIALAEDHRKHDRIERGFYWKENPYREGAFHGCALGCIVASYGQIMRPTKKPDSFGEFVAYDGMEALGFNRRTAQYVDDIFERLPFDEAPDFPLQFLNAVPVGAVLPDAYDHMTGTPRERRDNLLRQVREAPVPEEVGA